MRLLTRFRQRRSEEPEAFAPFPPTESPGAQAEPDAEGGAARAPGVGEEPNLAAGAALLADLIAPRLALCLRELQRRETATGEELRALIEACAYGAHQNGTRQQRSYQTWEH